MAITLGTATTITWGTTAWTGEIRGVTLDGTERVAVDASSMGQTGIKSKVFSSLVDGGTCTIEFLYDPADQPPYTAASETLTIAPGGDATNTIVLTGAVTGLTIGIPFEDVMSGSITFTITAITMN